MLRSGQLASIRYPVASDCDEYLALRRASADFHRPWEPLPAAGVDPYSAEVFAEYLATSHTVSSERLLICRTDDARIAGSVNIGAIIRRAFQSAFVGYWIGAQYAHQGYMTEGLGLVIEHAFDTLELHRLEANIRPENVASLALVKRLGFRKEGYSPRYLQIRGKWCDHERWAILSDDPR